MNCFAGARISNMSSTGTSYRVKLPAKTCPVAFADDPQRAKSSSAPRWLQTDSR